MTETEEAFAVKADVDRRIKEHIEMQAMVSRMCFAFRTLAVLNASLNPGARDQCAELAREAETLLARVRSKS